MHIAKCKVITLPTKADDRGKLGVIESNQHVPFAINRIFYIYDVPEKKSRGAHAHKALEQFIMCFGPGIDIEVDDGKEKKYFHLSSPNEGLYIPPLIWTSVLNIKLNSFCVVLASAPYDESDYLRDYEVFLNYRKHLRTV